MPKIDKPDEVVIEDKDPRLTFTEAAGMAGQSVNTTDSAVRVTHLPSGVSVAIQNERSQRQNKETAMTILRSRLAQLQLEQHQDHLENLKGPNQDNWMGQPNPQLCLCIHINKLKIYAQSTKHPIPIKFSMVT